MNRLGSTADRGSGSVVAVGLVGAIVALGAGLLGISTVLVEHRRIAGAADAGALAAADAASGLVAGEPCARALAVVAENGAQLDSCTISGARALVAARGTPLGIPVVVTALAGPPPGVEAVGSPR
jgi:secretion/DNA translocation related TadE-like protein